MLKGLGNIMKLQKDLKSIQQNLKKTQTKAESPDGLIKVTVNGEYKLVDLNIDERLLEKRDKENLEKQIISTINKAIETSREFMAKEMGKVTGGMNIPGLDQFLK